MKKINRITSLSAASALLVSGVLITTQVAAQDYPIVQMLKRNATSFAIDGNYSGDDGQDVYLWSENSSNINQQWYEIDRGDGYYSYQKVDTDFCLDGDSGGDDAQNVYLWTCETTNQNQHWLKVDMGDGHYRLAKRNASGYSIDGNKSGEDGQSIYLWSSSDSNQNQHWYFNYLSEGSASCNLPWSGTSISINNETKNVTSEAIDISCVSDVTISMDIEGVGPMETADYLNIYYRVDGGSLQTLSADTDSFSQKTVSLSGISGSTLEIVVEGYTSFGDEIYSISNMRVSEGDGDTDIELEGDIRQHDFNNGSLAPFTECTVQSPNYAKVVNGRVKTYWEADAYNGTRMTRGAEFCEVGRSVDPDIELRTKKHYWSGFTLNIHQDHNRTSDSSVAQTMGYRDWDSDDKFNTWTLLLSITNGDLVVNHRPGAGTPTTSTIVQNFSFGVDHDIVIGQIFSGNNNGMVGIWVDGVRVYYVTGINNGMGPFDDNDEQGDGQHSAFKLGMYNHTTDDYVSGEVRIVYYDNVTWYTGANGYDVVDPSN